MSERERCEDCAKHRRDVAYSEQDRAMLCFDCYGARAPAASESEPDALEPEAPSANAADPAPAAMAGDRVRTRGVDLERVRPLRWLWERRIPMGLLSLLVGEESIGKGTFAAWLMARATRGDLAGDLHESPCNVLLIGDEDGFEPIWVPRLYLAGADLGRLRTLDDGEYLTDLAARASGLRLAVTEEHVGLVVFDALLDHVPGGQAGAGVYNPKNVREALLPLRRVAGEADVACLGLMHPVKGRVSTFRDLVAASHQFNAVSRSSLLLAAAPDDETRRVLVRGKGNHSAAPRAVEFVIAGESFDFNGFGFEVPRAVDVSESDRTVADLLAAGPPEAPVRDELTERLADLLTAEPQRLTDLAGAVGRSAADGSVRNALRALREQGRAEQLQDRRWIAPGRLQLQPLTGVAMQKVVPAERVQPRNPLDPHDEDEERGS
jgi:hypothetical protein